MRGIIRAILLAMEGDIILSDSQVAIGWVRRGRSGARRDLNDRLKVAKDRMASKNLTLRWVPRKQNHAGIYNERHPARKPVVQ